MTNTEDRVSTSARLQQIMAERNIKQVDILEMAKPYCEKYDIKLSKSTLSQFVSGRNKPNQDKLLILGLALNVSEGWLMGLDVPMERKDSVQESSNAPRTVEASIVSGGMDQLPEKDRQTILNVIRAMYPNRPELFPDKKGEKEDDH